MSVRTAAVREEEAELNYLREQADLATAEAAQALAELTRRITVLRRPALAAVSALALACGLAYAVARGMVSAGHPERGRVPARPRKFPLPR